jgi:putative NADH-flavin reductase
MRLAIFGSTGDLGIPIVKQALAAGHDVVAYARDPAKLKITHHRLTVVHGEYFDREAIERAVSGADAVLSVLKPRCYSKEKPVTVWTVNILEAMKRHGVSRIVAVSTVSAIGLDDLPSVSFKMKLAVGIDKFTIGPAYEDMVSTVEMIRTSGLDWTIVRMPMVTNSPKTGIIRVSSPDGKTEVGAKISREDLAAFLLQQVTDSRYLRQTPLVSN